MNDNKPQAATRTTLARMYGVSIETFTKWLKINKELSCIIAPYISGTARTFPPEVVKKIFETFGEP